MCCRCHDILWYRTDSHQNQSHHPVRPPTHTVTSGLFTDKPRYIMFFGERCFPPGNRILTINIAIFRPIKTHIFVVLILVHAICISSLRNTKKKNRLNKTRSNLVHYFSKICCYSTDSCMGCSRVPLLFTACSHKYQLLSVSALWGPEGGCPLGSMWQVDWLQRDNEGE